VGRWRGAQISREINLASASSTLQRFNATSTLQRHFRLRNVTLVCGVRLKKIRAAIRMAMAMCGFMRGYG
jgi:hypothetical protein